MRRQQADASGGERLREILRKVRTRWRMRRVMKGGAVVLAAALAAILVTTFGLEATRFSATSVIWFRLLAWSAVATLFVVMVVRPLLKRVSDEQIALYLEEHEPSLEAAIMGAVAAESSRESAPESAALLDSLVQRAIERARSVEDGQRIDQQGLQRASGALATVSLVALLLLLFGPVDLRRGATALLPTSNAAAINPYSIGLMPGDLTIARGSDQLISAQLAGFTSDDVTLFTRSGENDMLQRLSMFPSNEEGAWDLLLLGLAEETEYFVEADGVRSPTFTIEVVDLPYVDQMDHVYNFPRYTGLDPREIEDAGDVAALAGTRVDLSILTTIPTSAGRLLVDGEVVADLDVNADGTLGGTLEVSERGYYQVELALGDGRFIAGSPEYRIDLLLDQPPSINFSKPGRDTKVSPIEEVFLEVEADDDYGIEEVDLIYSVNGGPDQTISLFMGTNRPLAEVTAGHTFYLEDFDVEPGDLVSYYARARDQRQGEGEDVISDIYFLSIEPFGRDFREAPQQEGGGGGGGGGGPEELGLSELQKEIIAATFNLVRDRDRYTDEEFSESATSVALAQGRVREQVSTLVERMNNRQVTDDEGFRVIAEMLPEALAAMDTAQIILQSGEVQGALRPEQQSLRVLQKAEETYERYVQLQQQQAGGGGGGGGQPNAEDLADLFELELDKMQNQYETVQRGERQQINEQVDELLETLEELARRQQQEAERQQARAQQGSPGGAASAEAQRALANQAEETARNLQRLARESGDPQLADAARELQDAADAMRRSAANAGNTGAAEASRALDRLEQAREQLEQDRENRLEEDSRAALDRGRRLAQQQEEITERLRDMPTDPAERQQAIREMQDEKTDMLSEIQDLERTLDRLASDARQRDAEAARAFTEAAEAIRTPTLAQRIAWSRGVIEQREEAYVRVFEEGIRTDLESLEDALETAVGAAERVAEQEGLGEALDQARDLVRGMESLDRRLESRTQEAQQGEGQQGEGQQGQQGEGQQGQQGEGQQGEGQQGEGQQGQQGEGQQGEGQQGQGQGQGQQGEGQQGQGQGQQGGQGQQQGGQGGQNGGNPGSPQGGQLGGGQVQGDPRAFSEEEIRQFRSEFQQRLTEAVALREVLREEGQETPDLDAAIAAMRQLQDAATYQDLPQVALLQETLRSSLGRLEFTLRRIVEGDDRDRAALSGSDAVPAGFRTLVEEYYRSLARERGGGGR